MKYKLVTGEVVSVRSVDTQTHRCGRVTTTIVLFNSTIEIEAIVNNCASEEEAVKRLGLQVYEKT